MKNLTQRQTIAIGVAALFGIPICVGLVVGYFLDFWWGVVAGVLVFLLIAFIAQRWWQEQARQKEEKDGGRRE